MARAWPPPLAGFRQRRKKRSMFYVYIIESLISNKKYIGTTSDIDQRIRHHNSGANISTKKRGPWRLIYQETYENKKLAWLREKQIKSYKGGSAFKKLLQYTIK